MIPNPPDFDRLAGPDDYRIRVAEAVLHRMVPVTPDLDKLLQRVVEHTYQAALWQVDFEVHDVFELDRKVDIAVHFYAEGYDELCADLPVEDALCLTLPPALTTDMFQGRDVDPESDEFEWVAYVAEFTIIGWFAERWRAVAAGRFGYRATIAVHDETWRFDLNAWEWSDSL